ncbi:methyltransferase domain-containing protein [Iocasia frigidifontis]|uniref:Methyltransferase domain-containing protein n=1 Tax=Iocasia fonsfrigidae TaxID=2682810 RepID=A0A8A7KFM4_9FIRM|nr:class I SAM-dependent methyltransferase [Iocasia fonsfrigidae]QTL97687.1 methyltransferase domain-containing protein [Iocasia fonsfrigidae]
MRRPLTPTEKIIYNNGERLIFGISHDVNEDIRHRSSYIFFKRIIDNDLVYMKSSNMKNNSIDIIDLGCGVGHGCETLSKIKNSTIMGVDSCQEAIKYAKDVYSGDNISYKCLDLRQYIPIIPSYDYVVSSQVLEHIPNGLELGFTSKWLKRLMLAVPYNEPKNRNPHHVLSDIREENFSGQNAELFYQDLTGIIYDKNNKPPKPNIIICICSHPALPKITDNQIDFPVPAWGP